MPSTIAQIITEIAAEITDDAARIEASADRKEEAAPGPIGIAVALTTGTLLTESRRAPAGISAASNVLVGASLGGTETFESSLSDGIRQTLERIKVAAEAA